MPARLDLSRSLRALQISTPKPPVLPTTPSRASRPFSSTPIQHASTVQQRRRHRDPYAVAQARARKAANLSRQDVLQQERTAALGDPVRGITTPFVQSFDTAVLPQSPPSQTKKDLHTRTRNESSSPDASPKGPNALEENHLNFFLNQDEVKQSIARSERLNTRAPSTLDDSALSAEAQATLDERQATATEALKRIASLANASSKDRLRVNVQRCISTFGRHNTDEVLPPKPSASLSILGQSGSALPEQKERAGPDTGSSEVQVAILTAKIRTLADFLETRGKPDKVNKRNLRVLVHKRQKLLTYLRRKERGGPRWQNLIETLGLTEGTWKGEISL